MALFSSWTTADLANAPKVERILAKLEVGAKVDMNVLWNILTQYQMTPAQDAGAKQIISKLQEVMLEVIQRCTNKYATRVYDSNFSFQFQKGSYVKTDLTEQLTKYTNRRVWCEVVQGTRVYIGACMICGGNDSIRLPIMDEVTFMSRQLAENRILHQHCQDMVKCAHCEEKLGEYQEVTYAQWAQSRLCPICFTSSRELITQPKLTWRQLKDRRERRFS